MASPAPTTTPTKPTTLATPPKPTKKRTQKRPAVDLQSPAAKFLRRAADNSTATMVKYLDYYSFSNVVKEIARIYWPSCHAELLTPAEIAAMPSTNELAQVVDSVLKPDSPFKVIDPRFLNGVTPHEVIQQAKKDGKLFFGVAETEEWIEDDEDQFQLLVVMYMYDIKYVLLATNLTEALADTIKDDPQLFFALEEVDRFDPKSPRRVYTRDQFIKWPRVIRENFSFCLANGTMPDPNDDGSDFYECTTIN